MSITLFSDTGFKGSSSTVGRDHDNLRDLNVGNGPRSIRMTSDGDAVLLCKKSNWNGDVMYLRGKQDISDLGDPAKGGVDGFRSATTSVRLTPFTVKVNVTIVTGEDGTLPGTWSSRSEAQADIGTIISMANTFYSGQTALLKISLADLSFRADEKRFRMSEKEWGSVPGAWKVTHAVDVVFPDTIEGAVGLGNFPWHGKFCLVSARRDSVEQMARTFVHELGHFWSLTHESGNNNPENIMTQSSTGLPLVQSRLRNGQIRDMQQMLATNLARQGDRIE
jgi:hypothetical protein